MNPQASSLEPAQAMCGIAVSNWGCMNGELESFVSIIIVPVGDIKVSRNWDICKGSI
jgi:hypothetical protein